MDTKTYDYQALESSLKGCIEDAKEDYIQHLKFYIRDEYKQEDVLKLIAALENNNYHFTYEFDGVIRKLYIGW